MIPHMPTVYVMFATVSAVATALLCLEWWRTRKQAPALWALSFSVLTAMHLSSVALADHEGWAIAIKPATLMLASAILVQGCFAFTGRRNGAFYLAVPIIWLLLTRLQWAGIVPEITVDEQQLVAASLYVFLYLNTAWVVWHSKLVRPFGCGVALLFCVHAIVVIARVFILGSATLLHEANVSNPSFIFFLVEALAYNSAMLFLFVGAAKDEATSNWRAEAQIDPLTGFLNRRAFLRRTTRSESVLGSTLALIDIDRFKAVNDIYGHVIADQLLFQVAGRIRQVVGPKVCAARLGGDEFAVWIKDVGRIEGVADTILAALRHPFTINDQNLLIDASIGLYTGGTDVDPSDMLRRADVALHAAKRDGGGTHAHYQLGMLEIIEKRLQMEGDLRLAIRDGQFRLAYQPILLLSDNTVVGYEALIRWHHPVSGLVSPADFVPLAEETGQIIAIGEWVLEEACRQAVSWPSHQRVAVNVSPAQFRSPLLLAHVVSALSQSGLPPHRLEIELTETAMVDDADCIAKVLAALQTLGVSVALDDFGTGYSSLAHLRDFPLDRIKIDRSFVATAQTDPRSMSVLKGIIQISHELGAILVGEGVETEEQLTMLRGLGCDCVQGYLIGRPVESKGTCISQVA